MYLRFLIIQIISSQWWTHWKVRGVYLELPLLLLFLLDPILDCVDSDDSLVCRYVRIAIHLTELQSGFCKRAITPLSFLCMSFKVQHVLKMLWFSLEGRLLHEKTYHLYLSKQKSMLRVCHSSKPCISINRSCGVKLNVLVIMTWLAVHLQFACHTLLDASQEM